MDLGPFGIIQREVLEKYGTIKIDCAILFEFGRSCEYIAFYDLVGNPDRKTCDGLRFPYERPLVWIPMLQLNNLHGDLMIRKSGYY